ncbi:MAG: hypothetical protein ABR577_09665 [Pyrinomonadaceae bacterium]
MNFIKVTAEDGHLLAINADQIEHVRYRPATNDNSVAEIEIMFAGNPERAFFSGSVAVEFWTLLVDSKSSTKSA